MTLYSTDFHLCPEGIRRYLVWSCLEDDHHPAAALAKTDYIQHRKECPECTDPVRLEVEDTQKGEIE